MYNHTSRLGLIALDQELQEWVFLGINLISYLFYLSSSLLHTKAYNISVVKEISKIVFGPEVESLNRDNPLLGVAIYICNSLGLHKQQTCSYHKVCIFFAIAVIPSKEGVFSFLLYILVFSYVKNSKEKNYIL